MLALLFTLLATAARADEFRAHPAEARLTRRAVAPDVSSGRAHRYRTVLREEAREGANFNGHYRVASWGCGTNCIEWAILDLKTGRVWLAPKPAESCWAPDGDEGAGRDWFTFRLWSSLLYLHTCDPSTDGRKTFTTRSVYVWTRGTLQLLRTEALP
ncbi:MAG: hypothetical protein JO315_15710 [Acidobacteria bacterium]|nr:hypothetical protein [Acidobacteriota bacterium]